MPMFDFHCPKCQYLFEELVFGDEVPSCPQCGESRTERRVSRQARKKRGPFPSRSALFIPPCAVPGIHHAEGTAGGAVPAPHVLPGGRTGRRSENVPVIPL